MRKKFTQCLNPRIHQKKCKEKCKENIKKKIKILKDRPDNGSYTLLYEENTLSPRPCDIFQDNNKFKKADKKEIRRNTQKEKGHKYGRHGKVTKGPQF
jgi:hypothetical protein